MANWSGITKQLKKERDLVERQLSALNSALTAFVGAYSGSAKSKGTRNLSAVSYTHLDVYKRQAYCFLRPAWLLPPG